MMYYAIVKPGRGLACSAIIASLHSSRETPTRVPTRADAAARVYVRRLLPFPGGEDGGSWTRGVFQRREPCLLPHLPGAALARRGRRFRLPVQDADFEYPFTAAACH